MLSGQGIADALNLLACTGSAVAAAGGLSVLAAVPAFLYSALRGSLSGWVQLLLITLISAVILRAATYSRDPTAREEDAIARQSRAFCLVPEAWLGWVTLGTSCAVPVHESSGRTTLLVGSLPSPSLIRTLAKEHGKTKDVQVRLLGHRPPLSRSFAHSPPPPPPPDPQPVPLLSRLRRAVR